MPIRPQVLILASRYDFACDYVVAALRSGMTEYLRLNVEDLPTMSIVADPLKRTITGTLGPESFEVDSTCLQSLYFRQPVFLRDASTTPRSSHDIFARAQWAAFIRSLLIFDCRWMNHPAATYVAEHKAVQLHVAQSLGFDVPRTLITNTPDAISRMGARTTSLAVKGLDTVLVHEEDSERFGYTEIVSAGDLTEDNMASAPAILQEALHNKTDLRVTVVNNELWCAQITAAGRPVEGDWRRHKDALTYAPFDLPPQITERCIALIRALGLAFGAIDLALADGRFYFLEVNPTGEWAWLEPHLGSPVAPAIARFLVCQPAAIV